MKMLQRRAAPNSALLQQWQDASWIWLSTDLNIPTGDWAFRTTYTPPSGSAAVSANILITADDYFILYINGQQIGGTRTPANAGKTVWAAAQGYSVTLNTNAATPIVFAVLLTNNGVTAAGLLAAIQLTLADGSTTTVSTGRSAWRATGSIPQNFEQPGTSDAGWATPVIVEQNAGNAPWGVVQLPGDLTSVALKAAALPATSNTAGTGTPTTSANSGPSVTGGSQGSSTRAGGGVVTTILITTGTDGSTITSTRTSTSPSASLQVSDGVSSGLQLMSTSTKSTSTSTSAAGAANAGTSVQSKTPVAVIAGATVGGVIILLLLLALLLLCLKRRRAAAVPPAAPAFDHDQILTAATLAPSSVARSPSTVSSPEPIRQVEPFMLQTRNDDGLRTKTYYEKNGHIWGNVRNTHHDRSPSASSGATSSVPTQTQMRTGELGVTMDRLHELAEELNRGLAERDPNTPRLMLVSGREAELLAANSANGSMYHGHGRHDSVALPPYEGRREEL